MPAFRPLTVALVSGGVPVTVVAGCASDSMYGVIVYLVGASPLEGALHFRFAEPRPALAWTPVTWPGALAEVWGSKRTSTQ
jgi:hypothetical protein